MLDPIVIVGPGTTDGTDPGYVEIDHGGPAGFKVRFREWRYRDGNHTTESADWLAIERGRYTQPDGAVFEAGTFVINGNGAYERQNFEQVFPGAPRVFLTKQTVVDPNPAVARVRDIDGGGFDAALMLEEAELGGHGPEEVGYLAIWQPAAAGEVAFNAQPAALWRAYERQIGDGSVGVPGCTVYLDEEQSSDVEVGHPLETVSLLTVGGLCFAEVQSHVDADPVVIRQP
jgi:hypothetical protein